MSNPYFFSKILTGSDGWTELTDCGKFVLQNLIEVRKGRNECLSIILRPGRSTKRLKCVMKSDPIIGLETSATRNE